MYSSEDRDFNYEPIFDCLPSKRNYREETNAQEIHAEC